MNIPANFRPVRPLAAALGACALLLLAGCHNSGSGSSSTGSGSSGGGGQTLLAFVTNNPSDYWKICNKGVNAAAAKLGSVNVQFIQPARRDCRDAEAGCGRFAC